MLVRYYQEMGHPFQAVEAALTRDPGSWLPQIVDGTHGRSMALVSRVGFKVGPRRVDREVKLSIAAPHHLGITTVMPIAWEPVSRQAVLPALEGDLELSPIEAGLTQLAISASYKPPLGWIGAVAEKALMRRIAEATIKDFLDHVAAGLESILLAEKDGAVATA